MEEVRRGDLTSEKAVKRYREEQVNGLSQKDLILMLYDGAIKFSSEAKEAMQSKDYVQSYRSVIRARDIITELLRILNVEKGGDVARNLQRLYVYMIGRLIEVNFTKETRLLDNVLYILRDLRSAWAAIDFHAAMAEMAGQRDGGNGCGKAPLRQLATNSRLLSVTA
jgi:flagellar protein FliS